MPHRQRWACALEVERQHGEDAPRFIAERIGALALAGDWTGVTTWRAIAGCLDQLRKPSVQEGEALSLD